MKLIKVHIGEWRVFLLVFAYVLVMGLALQKVVGYALTTGNIDSSYWVRFPVMLLLVGIGVLAWQRLLCWLKLREQKKYG